MGLMKSLHRQTGNALGAVALTAGLALGVGVPAVPARVPAHEGGPGPVRAAPAPPQVTERFKGSEPCDQQTQLGLDGCAATKVLAADRLLNSQIRVVWSVLPSVGRRDFVNAQAAWARYRTADCESQSEVYAGGSAQPMAYLFCLAADDASRGQDLRGFFEVITQGMSPKPKFP